MTRPVIALRRVAASLVLAGCLSPLAHAAEKNDRPAPQPIEAEVTTTVIDGGVRRELARGVYEVAFNPADNSLYVATSQSIPGVKGGALYKLDPVTLRITGIIYTDKKNFALALSPAGDTLWTTNSLQGAVTKVDVKTGEVLARLKFNDKSADGFPYGPRQVIHDPATDLLYVGAVGDPGLIWVVNASDMTLKHTITNAGKWVTGLLRDPDSKRLYAANGDGEVLVIDTDKHEIVARWKPEDGQKHLLLNLALDPKTHRLFVTDTHEGKSVLVFDTQTGKVLETLPVGDSMGIKFNPIRNELYITHRNQGKLSVLDATSYKVVKTYTLPTNPNSLWIDPTGQVLYVSIKEPSAKDYTALKTESVARIELDKQ